MSKTRNFEQASQQIRENITRHLSKYDDVLEGASDSEESEGEDGLSDKILEELLSSYRNTDKQFLGSARQLLKTALRSSSCLICIESIRKNDGIWTCQTCYASLHLNCVAKWSKDSIFMLKQQQEEDPQKEIKLCWSCPNCRTSFLPSQIPTKYFCYCGKEVDPKFDPWLNPHSCGEKCMKSLKPECKHKCVLLCHPGPCPPCPQMVTVTCYCAKSTPAVKRCSSSNWSCSNTCSTFLSCRTHKCPEVCHPGPCQPCSKSSTQSCSCGKMAEPRPCSTPVWKCGNKCGKKLGCGHHVCDYVCHEQGVCPPCPLSLVRHCPCGKSDYKLPCTQATPTCGDTCGKLLTCGSHYCAERCHRGNCPSCLQMVNKTCRCGSKSKEVQCSKQFSCDFKCKKIRDCRKHPCNKKCCSGDCAPCETMCGKTLNCKNHKCLSRCHQGPCYPCNKQTEIGCNCGSTKIKVPCGKEKNTKPPKCREICSNKSNCHHKEQKKHYCHRGKCPLCKQVCDKGRECGHNCSAECHDNVKVKVENKVKPIGPWEEKGPEFVDKKLPCPPCPVLMPVPCLGQHEIADFPCHNSKPSSCGRLCGRKLSCTNHTCARPCHRVRQAPDSLSAGINCKTCSEDCEFPRPAGCPHACNKGCHSGSCNPCKVNINMKCNCGLMDMFIKCGILTDASDAEKEKITCCKDQCHKLMTCGHRCLLTCHVGQCSPSTDCKKKVKLYCKCQRIKVAFRCNEATDSHPDNLLPCDSVCEQAQAEEKAKAEAEKKKESNIDINAQREAELLLGGKKKRKRNRRRGLGEEEEDEPTFFKKNRVYILSFAVVLISIGIYALK